MVKHVVGGVAGVGVSVGRLLVLRQVPQAGALPHRRRQRRLRQPHPEQHDPSAAGVAAGGAGAASAAAVTGAVGAAAYGHLRRRRWNLGGTWGQLPCLAQI